MLSKGGITSKTKKCKLIYTLGTGRRVIMLLSGWHGIPAHMEIVA